MTFGDCADKVDLSPVGGKFFSHFSLFVVYMCEQPVCFRMSRRVHLTYLSAHSNRAGTPHGLLRARLLNLPVFEDRGGWYILHWHESLSDVRVFLNTVFLLSNGSRLHAENMYSYISSQSAQAEVLQNGMYGSIHCDLCQIPVPGQEGSIRIAAYCQHDH